jgi:hypothetical protein
MERASLWPSSRIEKLCQAYNNWQKICLSYCQYLLCEVDEMLRPFGEPLRLNFGLNRWLESKREEAYSDWIEWLLKQLTLIEISEILCINRKHCIMQFIKRTPELKLAIRRELPVMMGHEGASGRLDLIVEGITDSGNFAIVIEVKKGDSVSADTEKQEGYFQALKDEEICFYPLLLVTDAPHEEINKFHVLEYEDFCLALRRFVVTRKNDRRGYVFLSFVLALAATIESNLLGISINRTLLNEKTLSYLTRFVESAND